MKIEKIYFEQLFPTGSFANQRLGMDITLNEHESSTDAAVVSVYAFAKSLVEQAFKVINPSLPVPISDVYEGFQPEKITPSIINLKDERVAILIENIENAQDKLELSGYAFSADKYGLNELYDKRFNELP